MDFMFYYEGGAGKPWTPDGVGDKSGRITGIKIRPRSIKHEKSNFKNCALDSPILEIPSSINYSHAFAVYHSYSVSFIRDDTSSADARWDALLATLPESGKAKW